jgi:hypothetical protein
MDLLTQLREGGLKFDHFVAPFKIYFDPDYPSIFRWRDTLEEAFSISVRMFERDGKPIHILDSVGEHVYSLEA